MDCQRASPGIRTELGIEVAVEVMEEVAEVDEEPVSALLVLVEIATELAELMDDEIKEENPVDGPEPELELADTTLVLTPLVTLLLEDWTALTLELVP